MPHGNSVGSHVGVDGDCLVVLWTLPLFFPFRGPRPPLPPREGLVGVVVVGLLFSSV